MREYTRWDRLSLLLIGFAAGSLVTIAVVAGFASDPKPPPDPCPTPCYRWDPGEASACGGSGRFVRVR